MKLFTTIAAILLKRREEKIEKKEKLNKQLCDEIEQLITEYKKNPSDALFFEILNRFSYLRQSLYDKYPWCVSIM